VCVHCERFRLERHRLSDVLTALNVSVAIPILDLCIEKEVCLEVLNGLS
jgi:hypothetical protein